jgi:hypothetical protein
MGFVKSADEIREGDLVPSCRRVATIPAATYLPYAYGRMDDWSQLNTADISVTVS